MANRYKLMDENDYYNILSDDPTLIMVF